MAPLTTNYRVLIIEDSIVASAMMTARIEREDKHMEVRISRSMRGGVEEFLEFSPDVVILDLDLPDSKMPKTVERIPIFAAKSKVFVVTGGAEFREQCLAAGASDFMEKNIGEDPTHFFQRIMVVLNSDAAHH